MTALAASKAVTRYGAPLGHLRKKGVATGVTIYNGSLLMLSASGYATPASTSSPTVAIGVADLHSWDSVAVNGQPVATPSTWPNSITNSGADGAVTILVEQGRYVFNNKAGDLVTDALMGSAVYIEDDQTVRATGASSAAAGILVGFNDAGLPIVQVFKA